MSAMLSLAVIAIFQCGSATRKLGETELHHTGKLGETELHGPFTGRRRRRRRRAPTTTTTTTLAAFTRCQHLDEGTPEHDHAEVPTGAEYDVALKSLDMEAVKADMRAFLTSSDPCWPSDQGNYGGLMARLAWHCSGSYRASDGIGGCTGGRQRFEPERSWDDNTNLDKARALLYPLKKKYGDALSWGDLFILAGTEAYRQAGMPVTRMCFGRKDEKDGSKVVLLGPTAAQQDHVPCKEPGNCGEPLGATTVGLVYVNPEGPMGVPDPAGTAVEIRRTFGTMGHSDRATVALIGGGHAIGKCHGACPKPAGNSPLEAFEAGTEIWQGQCGTGKGNDTVTSGFHGYWTTKPFTWDNEFFKYLLFKQWELHTGPGGHKQWRIKGETGGVMRLTSDMALLYDLEYKKIVLEFASDINKLNEEFDAAWDLLTTRGVGVWSSEAKCDDGSEPPRTSTTMRNDDVGYP